MRPSRKQPLVLAASALGVVFSVATSRMEPQLFATIEPDEITVAPDAPVEIPLRATVHATAPFGDTGLLVVDATLGPFDGDQASDAPAGGAAAPAEPDAGAPVELEGAIVISIFPADGDQAIEEIVFDVASERGQAKGVVAPLFQGCGTPCDATEDFRVVVSTRGDAPASVLSVTATASLFYAGGGDDETLPPAGDTLTLERLDDQDADAGAPDADGGAVVDAGAADVDAGA